MRQYNFFNKRRVSVSDMVDFQTWEGQDLRNYLGVHLEKGGVRPSFSYTLGDSSNNYGFRAIPQDALFDLSAPTGTTFGIPVSTNYGAFFIDSAGDTFGIYSNQTYTATPTLFQSSGNIDIPLGTGADGDYYIWIAKRDILDQTYAKQDKVGVTYYPKQYEGYLLYIVFNNATQPSADVIYLGKITKLGTTLTVTYANKIYAGIKQENVNISIDTSSRPTIYVDGTPNIQLKDHINANGTGTVNPFNAHGIHPDDMAKVNTANITDHCITTVKLSSTAQGVGLEAVGTTEIKDFNVTHNKLALNAIESDNILDLTITENKMAFGIYSPIGSITMWGGQDSTIPNGWVFCCGQDVAIASYLNLWNAFGNVHRWGLPVGSSSLFFKLPDLRGMFIRGAYSAGNITSIITPPNPLLSIAGALDAKMFEGGDPDKATRTSVDGTAPLGTYAQPGSYQQDTLQTHGHDITHTGNAGVNTGSLMHGNYTADFNDYTTQTNGRNSTETRATNAYLYYIIRII